MRKPYVLAVSNAWPPMPAGTGNMLAALLDGCEFVEVLAPAGVPVSEAPRVEPLLRLSGRGGGPFKLYSLLQHLEIVLKPLVHSLGRGKPAAVVCSQPLFSGVGGLLLKRLRGVPLVVLGHGEEFSGTLRSPGPMRWKFRLLKAVLDRSDLLVFNTENTQRLAQDGFLPGSARAEVFRPTLNLQTMEEADREGARRLVGPGRFVLMVGRLAQTHKGFDQTIRAMASMDAARLVIAGPDDQAALKELAAGAGLGDRVLFTGEVAPGILRGLFAECDVFAMPVREVDGASEGFGVVYLEAAYYGKPAIAGRTGGAPEAVLDGETGLIVDGQDVAAIREAILKLLCEPELAQKLGQTAAKRVREEFDSAKSKERFQGLLAGFMN